LKARCCWSLPFPGVVAPKGAVGILKRSFGILVLQEFIQVINFHFTQTTQHQPAGNLHSSTKLFALFFITFTANLSMGWLLTGRFAKVSVCQCMKLICQRLMSVHQCWYVSSPMSKILFKIDLKCIYKLPEEDNVPFDVRWIVHFGLKMFVSLSPISLSPMPFW